MHQTRNIITTNIFSLSMIWFIGHLSKSIDIDTFNQILVGTAITLFYIAIVIYVYKRLPYSDNHEIPPGIAPLATFVSIFILIGYLNGRVKVIKSNQYKVLVWYWDGEMTVLYFDLLKIQLLDSVYYKNDDKSKQAIITEINKHYNRGLISNPDFDFREWDGMLDNAAQRKETINNILK